MYTKALTAYVRGEQLPQIALKMGVSKSTVSLDLHEMERRTGLKVFREARNGWAERARLSYRLLHRHAVGSGPNSGVPHHLEGLRVRCADQTSRRERHRGVPVSRHRGDSPSDTPPRARCSGADGSQRSDSPSRNQTADNEDAPQYVTCSVPETTFRTGTYIPSGCSM